MKTTEEQQQEDPGPAVLAGVRVRLIQPDEQKRFDELIIKEHYLKNATWVGRRLFYVAEHQGQWLALMAWTTAAYNLKDREDWIVWSAPQRKRRRALVVNNSRFLILPHAHHSNLATRVMRLCLDRLSADWQQSYGHEVLLAESFVDASLFRGSCYRAGGWLHLGQTKGWSRSRSDFYEQHDRPKQLWVRELRRGARELLAARSLPEAYASVEKGAVPACDLQAGALGELRTCFEALPDWRRRCGAYPCPALAALVACATLCGVHRGQRSLAAFARELSGAQLQALGFRKKGRPRRYRAPSEATFFRFLDGVKASDLEKVLQRWQDERIGPRKADDNVIAVDGKTLCSSQGVEVVSAYACKSGRWLGSQIVQEGSNEIPAAQELLSRIDLEGQRVTLDAMHTQDLTARVIVQEGGGDYLMTVKGNQPGIVADLQARCKSLQRDFSPSAPGGSCPALRDQPLSSRGPQPAAL
jgi:hypothetical protein